MRRYKDTDQRKISMLETKLPVARFRSLGSDNAFVTLNVAFIVSLKTRMEHSGKMITIIGTLDGDKHEVIESVESVQQLMQTWVGNS
jgi:hypothetical protein